MLRGAGFRAEGFVLFSGVATIANVIRIHCALFTSVPCCYRCL